MSASERLAWAALVVIGAPLFMLAVRVWCSLVLALGHLVYPALY